MRRCLLAVWLGATAVTAATGAETSGKASVFDGDTFDIDVVRIRLHGIDAPELGQSCEKPDGSSWACDEAARNWLVDRIEGKQISCDVLERDPFGRLISKCLVEGVDLSEALVTEGLAWAFIQYSDAFIEQQKQARIVGAGIWQDGAEPTTPWAYREDKWNRAVEASPNGCPIKGNINPSTGEHVYHTPWSKYYARTEIDESYGEKWFCDEAEASAAGWRPAR